MRRVQWAPASATYAWLFDLLFASSPTVTWAPAGQLPPGFRRVEQFSVLPGGGGRSFMVSAASRRGSSAALTSYNALRPPRRRVGRVVLGLALRLWPGNPLASSRIDIGVAAGASAEEIGGALLSEHLAELLGRRPVVIAFGGGTGPYRKPVLQVFGIEGTPLGYVKIGWNDWTRAAVRREAAALRACAAGPMRLGVPDLLHSGQWRGLDLMVTAPLPRTARRPGNILPGTDVLREICELSPRCVTELAVSSWWADLRSRISGVADPNSAARLDAIADGLDSRAGRVRLEFGRWHGDLVPWNLARVGPRLFAWDWESSAADAPLGFDALHFHFQVAFVAERRLLDEAVALAARNAGPALASLGIAGPAASQLGTLHLVELAVRHEEARSAAGDADDRFYPGVLDLLEQAGPMQPASAGRPVADQAA
jgi:hypothetical protein